MHQLAGYIEWICAPGCTTENWPAVLTCTMDLWYWLSLGITAVRRDPGSKKGVGMDGCRSACSFGLSVWTWSPLVVLTCFIDLRTTTKLLHSMRSKTPARPNKATLAAQRIKKVWQGGAGAGS